MTDELAAPRGGPPGVEARLAFWWGLLVRLAVVCFAGYFLWRVRTILATALVALIISFAAQALVDPLCQRRIKWMKPHTQRLLATIFVYAMLVVGVCQAVRLLIHPFQAEFQTLVKNYPLYKTWVTEQVAQAQAWYSHLPLPADFQKFLTKPDVPMQGPATWLAAVLGATVAWASHVVELVLVPVLAFYFTLDGRKLRNQFLFLVPRQHLRQTLAILSEGGAIMRAYIVSQFWLAVIAGVVVGTFLGWLGMPYAVVLGLLAGITRAIPIVGPLIGGVPIVLLAFICGAQRHDPLLWLWVLTFFTSLHLVESKIIMPRFLGHALNLHAVVIIVALLVGGEFFGLTGMFLAAPIAALGRLLVIHYVIFPKRRARARALGTVLAKPPIKAVGRRPRAKAASSSGGRVLSLARAVRNRARAVAGPASQATVPPINANDG